MPLSELWSRFRFSFASGSHSRWPTNSVGDGQQFFSLLAEAGRRYESAEFFEAVALLEQAAEVQRQAAHVGGLESAFPSFMGADTTDVFGHLALGPALRAMAADLGLATKLPVLLVTPNCSNLALASCWQGRFEVVRLSASSCASIEMSLWPLWQSVSWIDLPAFAHVYAAQSHLEQLWEEEGRKPILKLPGQERDRASSCLKELGLEDGAWFVSLHVRNDGNGSAYGRNAEVESFRGAVQRIRAAGGHVVGVGTGHGQGFKSIGAITSDLIAREPWLQLYILSSARFHLGTQSGPASVANAFGTPVLLTNATGWAQLPYSSRSLTLFKSLRRDGLTLSLHEMIEEGLVFFERTLPSRSRHGELRWIDCTSEQIVLGVELMLSEAWNSAPTREERSLDSIHQSLVGYRGARLAFGAM